VQPPTRKVFASAESSQDGTLNTSHHCSEPDLVNPDSEPWGKPECAVPGCGAVPFNKRITDFAPRADLLVPVRHAMLFERGRGRLRSALELPSVESDHSPALG
jgi:hypothetical protein